MRFKAVFIREIILIARDKRALFLIIIFPVFMLLLYSYGVTFDIKNVSTAVLDNSKSAVSRGLIQNLSSTPYLDVDYIVNDYDEISDLFNKGEIILAFIIPLDFEKSVRLRQKTTIQLLANGSDANTAAVALGYQAAIISSYGIKLAAKNIAGKSLVSMNMPSVNENTRIWYNPELKSNYFIVPGVIAIVMMLLGSLLTSTSIVREKELGTIEMLAATPIKSTELIIGKISPYIIISLIDMLIVVIAGHYVLGVPIKGSVPLLLLGALLYLVCALGFGLFASVVSSTVSSSQLLVLLTGLLPSVLLSGFLFPIESMPRFVQVITYIVPARYFIIILRGIFLKGIGFDVLWPQFVFLLVFGLFLLTLAASKFEKKIG